MKKLALSALFVVMLFGSALAHDGAISLYTDETITVCNLPLGPFEQAIIGIYYVRDQGYDIGRAAEFRLEASNPSAIFIDPVWSPLLSASIGDVDNGISLAFSQCLGPDQAVAFIGTITVFWTDISTVTFTVRVVDHPTTQPPGINFTRCDPLNPMLTALGGTFVFNGSCNPGVQPKSWGAIKELYR
jgi:hypothetical protein